MTYNNYFILFRVLEQVPLEFREKPIYVSSRMPVVEMKRDQSGCEGINSSVVGRRNPGLGGRLIGPYNLSLCQLKFLLSANMVFPTNAQNRILTILLSCKLQVNYLRYFMVTSQISWPSENRWRCLQSNKKVFNSNELAVER